MATPNDGTGRSLTPKAVSPNLMGRAIPRAPYPPPPTDLPPSASTSSSSSKSILKSSLSSSPQFARSPNESLRKHGTLQISSPLPSHLEAPSLIANTSGVPVGVLPSSPSSALHAPAGQQLLPSALTGTPATKITTSTSNTAATTAKTATMAPAATPSRSRSRSFGGEIERVQHKHCVRFHPHYPTLFASVNCRLSRSPDTPAKEASRTGPTTSETPFSAGRSMTKKLGPQLVELGVVQGVVQDWEARKQGRLLDLRPLAVSRGNPQLGTNVASTCLSFSPSTGNSVKVATGLTTGALCIHEFRREDEAVWSSLPVKNFPGRRHRSATAVAWRPNQSSSHVAIGTMTSNNTSSGVSGGAVQGNFCCLLWDVEQQSSAAQVTKGKSQNRGPVVLSLSRR